MSLKSVTNILNQVLKDSDTSNASLNTKVSSFSRGTATEIQTSQDLSVAALSYTTSLTDDFIVSSVSITFSDAVTEDVTLTHTNSDSNYDTIISLTSLSSNKNYYYLPEAQLKIFGTEGQQLKIECTDDGGAETAYVTINLEVV